MLNEHQAAAVGFTFPCSGFSTRTLNEQHEDRLMSASRTPAKYPDADPPPSPSFPLKLIAKPRCSMRGCKRVPAPECGLCKACCQGRGHGCSGSKHRSGPPQRMEVHTFTPSRPSPTLPAFPMVTSISPCSPSGSTAPSELPVTARFFREDMPDEWASEWNERQRKARESREAAEMRKKNELAIARQIVIQLWRQVCAQLLSVSISFTLHLQNRQPHITIRQQNILTYPTLNIAQCPTLMTKMDINEGAVVEIWNPRIKQWRLEDVDHSMNIKGQPELFIRLLGVVDCPGHKQLIGEEPDNVSQPTVDNGKRRLELDGEDESLVAKSRHSAASTWLPSPFSSDLSLAPLSPYSFSMTPSPLSSMPSSPAFSSLGLPTMPTDNGFEMFNHLTALPSPLSPAPSISPPSINTYDSLWILGYVYIPENRSPWPAGMYARDMAWALTRLNESRGDVKMRFHQVFPGVPWVKATYYRHKDAFFGSTSSEIVECQSLSRSAGGLWMDWKARSTGSKMATSKKKQA